MERVAELEHRVRELERWRMQQVRKQQRDTPPMHIAVPNATGRGSQEGEA